VLIYPGKSDSKIYTLEECITVHVISLDLTTEDESDFEKKCDDFMIKIENILYSSHRKYCYSVSFFGKKFFTFSSTNKHPYVLFRLVSIKTKKL
jgi:hypothetical protein